MTVDRLEPFGEAEWFADDDWEAMTRWVDDHFGFTRIGKLAVLRKSRLFACQCCRFLWPALNSPDSRTAVEVAERFAERKATKDELTSAFRKANAAAWATGNNQEPAWAANNAACETPYTDASASQLLAYVKSSEADSQQAEQLLVAWLWDIFGNPFRPVTIDPTWLTGTVVALAQTIYDARAFDRMPDVAEGLEAAGCTNADLLNHCRKPGVHVRGCWALDRLLGKE